MPITEEELQQKEIALLEAQRELAENNAILAGHLVETRKLQLRNEELRKEIRRKTAAVKNAALIFSAQKKIEDDDDW